jgi:hypothetical protein
MKVKSPMNAENWDPSSGEMSCVSMSFTVVLHSVHLGMAL